MFVNNELLIMNATMVHLNFNIHVSASNSRENCRSCDAINVTILNKNAFKFA